VEKGKVFFVMENVEKMLVKGRDDVVKVKKLMLDCPEIPQVMREILGGIISSIDNVTDAVEAVASVVVDVCAGGPEITAGHPSKRRIVVQDQVEAPKVPKETEEQVKKKKFAQAVKEAEKSVLLFNLDLGKVPIMNTTTIAKQVTTNITSKAALAEGKQNGRPTEDTIMELDDALSMSSGMDFFGKVTKPYQNKKNTQDPANGTYCTMPVKMNFKSKDARAHAEKLFRKKCNIACAVPYPQRLRLALNKSLTENKAAYPGCFIQIRVDTENFALVASRKTDKGWINNYQVTPLDMQTMDLGRVGYDNSSPMEVSSQKAL
jgi:hypothetical protein